MRNLHSRHVDRDVPLVLVPANAHRNLLKDVIDFLPDDTKQMINDMPLRPDERPTEPFSAERYAAVMRQNTVG